jgi:hypothetical protein
MKANIEALSMALKSRGNSALRWSSRSYPEETHDGTVIKSYFDGLRMIFADYNYPRDPNTNMLLGSLDGLKSHFVKLSEQLGAPLDLPELLVNELGYDYLRTGRRNRRSLFSGSISSGTLNRQMHGIAWRRDISAAEKPPTRWPATEKRWSWPRRSMIMTSAAAFSQAP